MKIRKFSNLESDIYSITLQTEDWSEADKNLMVKYGEPTINLGGTFLGQAPTYVDYTLDNHYAKIMTESPFTQRFDIRDYADAEARAVLWKLEISTRISEALTTLRSSADTFTDEEVETV